MIGRIYIIKNIVNSKVYIGQTKDSIQKRFGKHLSSCQYVIGKAIKKYGSHKFHVELLEETTLDKLNEREMYWIKLYNSTDNRFGYNMSIGGNVTRKPSNINVEEVIDLFNNGISAIKIAKTLHTDIEKITSILKDNNIKYGIELQKVSELIELGVVEDYINNIGTMDIANKYDIRKGTVRRILQRNNINIRNYSENKIARRNLLLANATPREHCTLSE